MVLNCLWNFFTLFRQIMHDLMPVLHDWILRGFYLVYCYVREDYLYRKKHFISECYKRNKKSNGIFQ